MSTEDIVPPAPPATAPVSVAPPTAILTAPVAADTPVPTMPTETTITPPNIPAQADSIAAPNVPSVAAVQPLPGPVPPSIAAAPSLPEPAVPSAPTAPPLPGATAPIDVPDAKMPAATSAQPATAEPVEPASSESAPAPSKPTTATQPEPTETQADPTATPSADTASTTLQPQPAQAETAPPAAPEKEDTVRFNLTILDFNGKPIAGLKYRVVAGSQTFNGGTNAKGRITEIVGLEPNQPLEFFVRKSDGEYSSKYKGRVECADMNVCAVSPHIKITLETEPHAGPAGVAPPAPKKPVASTAPVAPAAGAIVGDGKHTTPATQPCRTPEGNPKASMVDKSLDWAKRNLIPTFMLWSWNDFKPQATGCTVPAYQPPSAKPPPPAGQPTPGAPKPASAPAAAKSAAHVTTHPAGPTTVAVATAHSVDQAVPLELTRLIAILEEQAGWEWKAMFDGGLTSAALLAGIANNTFVPTTGKPKNRPGERCYASVKVGLLRAGIVRGINPDIPAKGAGPWLLSQGFRDVTATTPDGRWALPGDVLVYRYPDAKEAANDKKFETAMAAYEIEKAKYDASTAASNEKLTLWKNENALFEKAKAEARKAKQTFTTQAPAKPNSKQPKKPSAPTNKNYGHIEVRTYDGYISDFKTVNFALPRNLVLIGVYRKICDPVAELRVLAYLEVIASRETKGFSEEKSWYISNAKIDGSKEVKSIAKHPWVGRPQPTRAEGSRAAGRFQIMLATYTEAVETYGLPDSFLPANQQRIAVLKFETRKGLGLVRAGKIEEATHVLSDEWASLPGGSQNRDYSMSQLLSDHQKFMKELIK